MPNTHARVGRDLVRAHGWRCDTVSFFLRNGRGNYRLTCNDDRYVYRIHDVGGRWFVEVQ